MRNLKAKTRNSSGPLPIWCNSCFIRIAPYDLRTVHRGKDYHRACLDKMNGSRKTGKN
jgi:hypothetical protein